MAEREQLISIVRGVQNGDEKAADTLYRMFYKDIYYQILKTVDNDGELAADLTQETFLEILRTIHQLKEPAAFVTWSRQIAYHQCTAYFRKRRELLADENEDGYSEFDKLEEERTEFIPDAAVDQEDFRKTIQGIIDALPPEQKSAIMLRYFSELSVKEIAEIQGVTEGTVKSRLNYGRKAIKQSVEDYEKKHDVRLHCVGVIPLLLWLARGYRAANGAAVAAEAASAASAAAEGAASAAGKGIRQGAKTAGKAAARKVIAAVAAAAVTVGGVTVGLLSRPEEKPSRYVGYGSVFHVDVSPKRFELTVEEQDDQSISGHLEVSSLYEVIHDTQFEGSGTKEGGRVVYEITFETPLYVDDIVDAEYTRTQMAYNKDTSSFSFDGFYDAELAPVWDQEQEAVLAENAVWSGYGTDLFYSRPSQQENHLFTLEVTQMTGTAIAGRLTVSYQGQTDHVTAFTGRGFTRGNEIHFEIHLEEPRQEKQIIMLTVDNFWMIYDRDEDTFRIPSPCLYDVTMGTKKMSQ